MYDIIYCSNRQTLKSYKQLKETYPSLKFASSIAEAKKKSLTKFFWIIPDNVILDQFFDFSYEPDDWSQDVIHVFLNAEYFDGISLIPRNKLPTEKEFEHRFYAQKKEVDIQASKPKPYDRFYVTTYDHYIEAIKKSETDFFWVIPNDILVNNNFDFSYQAAHWEKYPHVFLNGDYYDGVSLHHKEKIVSKKEFEHRFYAQKKEVDIQASKPKPYNLFEIDTYNDYEYALKNSSTDMFWMSSPNISVNQDLVNDFYFSHHNTEDRSQNHAFVHEANGEKYYNGLFLCSKKQPLTKREVEYRFPVNRREWNLLGSSKKSYDLFEIETYEDYEFALENSTTEMFWMSSPNIKVNDNLINSFYFTHDNEYDRCQNHAFVHEVDGEKYYNGLFLCSKKQPLTKREVEYRFPVNRKEWDIVGSTSVTYEIFEL